jgi:CheY-like chemotaxis protein
MLDLQTLFQKESTVKKILHTDDVARFRELVQLEFEADFEVVSLDDCDKVLQVTAEQKPDLVILDHLMPSDEDNSGFEICQLLRKDHPTLPVVIFTGAWEGERDQAEVEQIWGTKVVFKSQGTEALREVVEQMLSAE